MRNEKYPITDALHHDAPIEAESRSKRKWIREIFQEGTKRIQTITRKHLEFSFFLHNHDRSSRRGGGGSKLRTSSTTDLRFSGAWLIDYVPEWLIMYTVSRIYI